MGCSSSSPAAVTAAVAGGSVSGPSNGVTGGTEKDAAAPTSASVEPSSQGAANGGNSEPAPSADYDDPSSDEPCVPVAVGYRRGSYGPASPGDGALLPPQSPGQPAAGPGRTLPRMGSAKNVPLGGGAPPTGEESAGGGMEQENFMENIHSSPFDATLHFEAPVYPKSDEDVAFV